MQAILDFILDALELLIPISAVSIPLVIVLSYFVVDPIVKAIGRLKSDDGGGRDAFTEKKVLDFERRLSAIETVLDRLVEAQEFDRKLRDGSSADSRSGADREPALVAVGAVGQGKTAADGPPRSGGGS